MKLVLKEKKAKEVLERIIKDLNKRFNVCLFIDGMPGYCNDDVQYLAIICMYIRDSRVPEPLVCVKGDPTYAKLLNEFVNCCTFIVGCHPARLVNIRETYGSTYEEIMMNLDLRLVE